MPGPNPSILKMRSGQNAVAGGTTQPGWVSGDIASLAAAINAPQSAMFSPMDRYFIVQATNADGANPQGAGAFVQLAANPFI